MSLYSGQIFGSYEIVKLLGRGGMGEVYLATDTRLNRPVAIKILSSDLLPTSQLIGRFRREASLAAVLNHPNICTIYETGEAEGQVYICMEYVEGETLRERLQTAPMKVPEILDIAIQIADALDEARRKNIVHRDIKTGNILLASRSHVKILDFGLAKQFRDSALDWSEHKTESHLTQTGDVRGTVAYMSPEQALGKTVDHRSDIFSFGIVLYEMLAGRLPFTGNSTTEVVDAIIHKDPVPVTRFNDGVTPDLVRVLKKMLDKDREMRYQSVHEVWIDLRRIRGDTTTTSARADWSLRSKRFRHHRAAIAAVLLIAIAAAIAWLVVPSIFRKKIGPQTEAIDDRPVAIAVLPFRYGGEDPARGYLGTMVTDALIAGLQAVPGLAVAPYENVRQIQELAAVRNVARDLGVDTIVKGVVFTKGDTTEISAEILSENGKILSKQTFSGRPIATMDLIKQYILSALQMNGRAEKEIGQVRTPSMEAYQKYLEARNYQEGWDVDNSLDQAASLYREAIVIDPDFSAARARLAMTLITKFHEAHEASLMSAASAEAKRALALDPNLPEALLAHGVVQLESGNSIEAQNAFARALELAPGDDSACRNLGALYSSLGRNKEATQMYNRAIDLRSSYWKNHYELGIFEWQFAGNFDSARSHLEEATKLHPEGFAPLVGLGIIHLTQGNLDGAESYFRQTLERSPNLYAYNNLGLVYYYRGQYDLALRNWQALLKEAPDKPLNVSNVADALRQLGQKEEAREFYSQAIKKFRTALELNRVDDRSRGGLAMALAATGNCKEALDEARGVLGRHPDSPELSDYAAIAVSRCKDWRWAKEIALNSIASNNLLVIRFDPDVKPVRELPEVKAALEKQIRKSISPAAGPQS